VALQVQTTNTGRKHAYFARNRAALLRSAQAVLADRGAGATIEEFASAADVSISTIYKHFENRDALIQSAVVAGMDEWEAAMLDAMSSVSDPLELLVLPIRLFIKMPKTHPVLAKAAFNSPGAVTQVLPRLSAGFSQNLRGLVGAGVIELDNVDARISAMLGVIRAAFEVSVSGWPATEAQSREMLAVGLEIIGIPGSERDRLMYIPLPLAN